MSERESVVYVSVWRYEVPQFGYAGWVAMCVAEDGHCTSYVLADQDKAGAAHQARTLAEMDLRERRALVKGVTH